MVLVVLNFYLLLISLSRTLQIITVISKYMNLPLFQKASSSMNTFSYYYHGIENLCCGIVGYDTV